MVWLILLFLLFVLAPVGVPLADVILLVKQLLMFISVMLLGNVTILINASAGLMIDIHTLLEKVIALLIG